MGYTVRIAIDKTVNIAQLNVFSIHRNAIPIATVKHARARASLSLYDQRFEVLTISPIVSPGTILRQGDNLVEMLNSSLEDLIGTIRNVGGT
jgi:hypothetical protein